MEIKIYLHYITFKKKINKKICLKKRKLIYVFTLHYVITYFYYIYYVIKNNKIKANSKYKSLEFFYINII